MDFKYELTVVPVSDVDRAKEFYAEKLGFNVDVDHSAGEHFRVVQLTPPGSAASITIGTGLPQAERGLEISEPFHFGAEGQTPGLHPERADYGSYLSFKDPDGNGWLVQEVTERSPGR